MPTLLEKDKIVPQKWMSESFVSSIGENQTIDVLMNYIEKFVVLEKVLSTQHKSIGEHVLVLKSGTGTGKSTIIPPALYRKFFPSQHKNIIITQPTILTTTEIPYQIVQYNPDIIIGKNIGYQTSSLKLPHGRGILFSTVGILLQYLRTMTDKEFKKKFSFILIDEVHNRTTDLDMTLYYLKQLLIRNYKEADCPFIILMSASFDPIPFMKYFECGNEQYLEIIGYTYPIKDNYVKYDVSNYLTYITDKIEEIHLQNIEDLVPSNEFRDIIVFLPGLLEMKKIEESIHSLNINVFAKGLEYSKNHSKNQIVKYEKKEKTGAKEMDLFLLPIIIMSENIQRGDENYKNLFSPIENIKVELKKEYEIKSTKSSKNTSKSSKNTNKNGKNTNKNGKSKKGGKDVFYNVSRRIILATNAAETGITIDSLKYCIDSGFAKMNFFDPVFGVEILIKKNVTQANSMQRRGRVGRKHPGEFFACYTKSSYDFMQKIPFSNILLEDITPFLLNIITSETNTRVERSDKEISTSKPFRMNKFDQESYQLVSDFDFKFSENLDFIKNPSVDSINYAVEKLYLLGLIDSNIKPTLFGVYANKFKKVSIESIRMILAGYHHNTSVLDLITIASFLYYSHKIFVNKKEYKPRNLFNMKEKENKYYYYNVFRDDFIEFLFIWYDYITLCKEIDVDITKANNKSNVFSKINEWGEENSLSLSALYDISQYRDEIIFDMIAMGLNPYYNGSGLPNVQYSLINLIKSNLNDGLEEISKIKNCIYEGYKLNLCIWNGKEYINQANHLPLMIKSEIIKKHNIESISVDNRSLMPKFLVYNQMIMTETIIGIRISTSCVSILDNYVDIDVQFSNF